MLPRDYSKAVLALFRKKYGANLLSIEMRQLSTASLKTACSDVCRERYKRKDELVLKSYFKEAGSRESCLQAIPQIDNDDFRTVVNFLKGKTTKPEDKVVELAAWLVDFEPRPYDPSFDYSKFVSSDQEILLDTPQLAPASGPDELLPSVPSSNSAATTRNSFDWTIPLKWSIAVAVGLAVFGVGYYWLGSRNPPRFVPTGPQGCMYWAGDHYERISCSQPLGDTLVIALDSVKLANFKKITRPDTITTNSIGKLWYVRYRGDYEFYTLGGFHPIDPQLRLKPVTEYIINRHVSANP